MIFETICFEKVCAFIKQLKHKRFQHGVKLMSTCTAPPRVMDELMRFSAQVCRPFVPREPSQAARHSRGGCTSLLSAPVDNPQGVVHLASERRKSNLNQINF